MKKLSSIGLIILLSFLTCAFYACTKPLVDEFNEIKSFNKNQSIQAPVEGYTFALCPLPDGTTGWLCYWGKANQCIGYFRCRPFTNPSTEIVDINSLTKESIMANYDEFLSLYESGYIIHPQKLIESIK